MDIKEKVKSLVKDEEVISLVKELVQIASHWAQDKREKPISDYLMDFFKDNGIETYQQ